MSFMSEENSSRFLSVEIPSPLFEAFDKQRLERGQVKKAAVVAAIKLWIELPEEIQARLLNQALDGSAFVELVEQIVDERIAAGRRDMRRVLRGLPRSKPSPKG